MFVLNRRGTKILNIFENANVIRSYDENKEQNLFMGQAGAVFLFKVT
jgi:hypothetical protein